MYLYSRFIVHSETRTQYRLFQTQSSYPLTYHVLIATCLCNRVKLKFT
ncbi:unnamed protein product [Schistosoma curassoni]|uniref:Uncharacterized protein n=1 Tax=Schistosoma curassoni TaxID=6186 RepID=A0A183K8T1_9TREM|nr:unnamed protein product [Schistosoma curassoni]